MSNSFTYDKHLVNKAAIASVCVATILIVLKLIAWRMTNSLSLQASLIDSLLDAAASIINMIAVRHAHRPPTEEYRFGHGKSEALACLAQSLCIAGSSGWLIYEGINRLFDHATITESPIGIITMVISMTLTYFLLQFQKHVIKKTNSAAIKADSLHYQSDFLINGGVILSLLCSAYFNWFWFDSLFGVIIAFYILYTAWQITRDAFAVLMDKELEPSIRNQIVTIATDHPKVQGIHQLRTRSSGFRTFIQLHLEMDEVLTLKEAHKIADAVEAKILKAFPDSEVIIHEDPIIVKKS